MDERLKHDLYARANSLYEVYQDLSKEFMPEKWCDSKCEFEIVEKKKLMVSRGVRKI